MKPDSSEAYKLLSQINEALGEHELAIKNYKKSLELKLDYEQQQLNNSFGQGINSFDKNNLMNNNNNSTPNKLFSSPMSSPANNKNIGKVSIWIIF